METIHIIWDGPISASDVCKLNGPGDYGLYQFYGAHEVYGPQSLLYIGRAKEMKLGERIKQHNLDAWVGSSATIYVGRLCGKDLPRDKIWGEQIDKVERLLIYVHAPSWNSANIQDYGNVSDLHVLNWGDRGQLLPEVSTLRWSAPNNRMPTEFKIYEEL